MSDETNIPEELKVTNKVVTKTSNLIRITYFLLGVIASAVILYNAPASGPIATNVVGSVVDAAPVVLNSVSTWVSDTAASFGSE